jgi:transposase InsO family protein
MQIDGIRGRCADLYYANPGLGEYYGEIPNRKQDVLVTGPNQVWVGDITYLKLGRQWRYLAVVLDHYSRRVIGWALGRERTSALTLKALNQATRLRKPERGVVFHSDRGAEYSAQAYRGRLASVGFIQIMNRPRRMNDNAHMESFFHSMKADVIHRCRFQREEDYAKTVRSYMPYYNNVRRDSALNYCSPANYELGMAA